MPLDCRQAAALRAGEAVHAGGRGGGTAGWTCASSHAPNADLRAKVAEGRFREDLVPPPQRRAVAGAPLRERTDDIVHLANIFLQQFARAVPPPAHHFRAGAEGSWSPTHGRGTCASSETWCLRPCSSATLRSWTWPTCTRFHGAPPERPRRRARPESVAAVEPVAGADAAGPVDRCAGCAKAMDKEIAGRCTRGGRGRAAREVAGRGPRPHPDTVGGVSAAGPTCWGCRKTSKAQLQSATGIERRGSPCARIVVAQVASALEEFIRARRGDVDVCEWAEACLLEEIESAARNDARTAAALLGVSEPTLWRRKAERTRQFS